MDGFTTNWKFDSLQAAVDDIRRHFYSEQEIPCQINTRSGVMPVSAPRYLYRGECGLFPETESSEIRFSRTAALQDRDLEAFEGILKALKWVLTKPDYANLQEECEGLLEHYGIPTSVINFTASLEVAAAFAAGGASDRGRICILTKPYHGGALTWDYRKHPWAARASRQEAFGVRPINFSDLKSHEADFNLGAIWVEFGITPAEREACKPVYESFLQAGSDPYAAILRGEINHYVERFGKIPHRSAKLLVDRIPMVPLVHIVSGIDCESEEIITRHVNPSVFPCSEDEERQRTLRYWSEDYQKPGDFLETLYPFNAPREVGRLFTFPGTFHGSTPPQEDLEAVSKRLIKLIPTSADR